MSNLVPPILTRDMPLKGELIDYNGLKIQPLEDIGMFMIQKSISFDENKLPPHSDLLKKLNQTLPKFGKCTKADDILFLSVTPISWLAISSLNQARMAEQVVYENTQDFGMVITEMSDQYMRFDLSGKHARNLLAKGCELDLSEAAFGPYACSRTLLAHLNVVIWRDDSDDLSLFIDASFAEHLWLWLQGAAKEYSK